MNVTMETRPQKSQVAQMRVHDYLYDSAFIVSGARDYARAAFKAAMASAQVGIQPVYITMFSELTKFPSAHIVYHTNCRLPDHMDRSYSAYVASLQSAGDVPPPQLTGKDRFKFAAFPKKVLALKSTSPDFHPPTPTLVSLGPTKPRSRGTQSEYRESSAQTTPWQPDCKASMYCENTPEVLYLDKLTWGPGQPFRTGDLPADFHTTEIINKMRHTRTWSHLVEQSSLPRWMKKQNSIIEDVETRDWIFREAEIDELQDIRLEILHRIQNKERKMQNLRTCRKLSQQWYRKKQEMQRKVQNMRHTMDRELRKLTKLHGSGGRAGQVARLRASRGHGSMMTAARNPTSDLYAPLLRHGYQARRRHAEICYDPALLSLEDHKQCAEPPAWLESCGQNLHKTCSGHYLPRDKSQLCERETKWSEDFLEQLHNDLKKARLGAAGLGGSAAPLHVLKPRKLHATPRPRTPEVEGVDEQDETNHQAALLLQRILRGRAVQNLMYEGRTRAAELTEELKTTHGLQKEDRARIAKEEAKSREYTAIRTEAEQKEDAISALVEELCGGAVAAALDFLEKELRRLKEERRQHAFILIALREKTMREAAEAGRRQKELHRLREHDEMFKHVLGVTQETVDAYLREVVQRGVDLAAEEEAVRRARAHADAVDAAYNTCNGSLSTAEQHESVAELVQQFLLPEIHKEASQRRIAAMQNARARSARDVIFGVLDEAINHEDKEYCTRCGVQQGEVCRCFTCPIDHKPQETSARDDPRWKLSRLRQKSPERSPGEKYPPQHEFRCMLNTLVYEVVTKSNKDRDARESVRYDAGQMIREKMEVALDAKAIIDYVIDRATGLIQLPVREAHARHYMSRVIGDALARTEPYEKRICPKELPSEIRRRAEEEAALLDPTCRCHDAEEEQGPKDELKVHSKDPEGGLLQKRPTTTKRKHEGTNRFYNYIKPQPSAVTVETPDKCNLLPSELRTLEELRRCKCDTEPAPSNTTGLTDDYYTTTDFDTDTTQEVPLETEETEATKVPPASPELEEPSSP